MRHWLPVVVLVCAAIPAQEKPAPQKPAAPDAKAAVPQDKPAPQGKAGTEVTAERLEQLVAPIALYPDALLSQVLMASTYPLEIVEAARWVQKNPKVTGDKLEAALKSQEWEPSVKSLCGFPEVLKRMNDNLEWMQDLGDAFLSQQARVLDAVQQMRRKALEAGTLKSGKEQKVTEKEDKIIVIETVTETVYVPTYYPSVVYGGWSYPYWYYPTLYAPPPAGAAWFGFTAGVIWGAAIWGGCHWGWGHSEVDIDINRYNNFNRNTDINPQRGQVADRAGQRGSWQHKPEHRGGVAYKDNRVAQRYGAAPGTGRVTKDQARGYGDRAAPGTRPATGGTQRPQPTQRPAAGTGTRPSAKPASASQRTGQSSGSFSGAKNPSLDKASSTRGNASRGTSGSRSSGGARTGGGGRSGGGGRAGGGGRGR